MASIKNAMTSNEVLQALLLNVTADGAIATIGSFASGIVITTTGNQEPFVANGKEYHACGTNKFLASAEDAVLAFSKKLPKNVEDAKEMAYDIIADHGVTVTVWEDTPNREQLLARLPFTARVVEREFEDSDGNERVAHSLQSIVMDKIHAVNKTASSSLLELLDAPVEKKESSNRKTAAEIAAARRAKAQA